MKALRSILLMIAVALSGKGFSNTAQPGIFDAGGACNFMLVYAGDSVAFSRIQIIEQHVAIQLYRGFAVIRSEYRMTSSADSILNIKLGYPVNAVLKADEIAPVATNIFFDQLYALKSYTNGRENSFMIMEGVRQRSLEEKNWYVWESSFKPHDTTTLVVYFVVNTNNAEIREGITSDKNNVFAYFFSTGAPWKGPILNGEVKVALMDELRLSDIAGISPPSVFRVNETGNMLLYRFSELFPVPDDNLVIAYTANMEQFDFGYISQKRQLLFGSIDSFAKQSLDGVGFSEHSFNSPYKAHAIGVTNVIRVFVLFGVAIISLIVLFILLRILVRRIRERRPPRGTEI